jgi:hypothetical protein
MKLGRIGVFAVALGMVGAFAQAALPKPKSLIDKVETSQSRGTYGFRTTKYNQPAWGNRWHQTLGRAPIIMAPSVRGY